MYNSGMNILLLNASLAVFAIIGFVCCGLFYEQSRDVKKRHVDTHVVCNDESCSLLLETKYYHLFYVPNWWYGLIFYLIVLASSLYANGFLEIIASLAAIASCLVSIFLIWALFFKLRTVCRVCYIAHAANALILITLIVRYLQTH
jgi:uncharacterized membrane protein